MTISGQSTAALLESIATAHNQRLEGGVSEVKKTLEADKTADGDADDLGAQSLPRTSGQLLDVYA